MIRNTITLNNGETHQRLSKTMRYTGACVAVVRHYNGETSYRIVSWHTTEALALRAQAKANSNLDYEYASVYPVTRYEYGIQGTPWGELLEASRASK